ncbi:MAG: choice-of-anchor B domain-containing protein [Parvicella sp.]|jgi:choice-of-anchor B domain-containing protein
MKKCLIYLICIFFFGVSSMYGQSKNVNLLDNWADTLFQSWYGDKTFNEVWGFVQDGQEYAIIGSANGTNVIKINDDNTLERKQFILGRHIDATHRDFHDYNGYLYEVCDQGSSSLRVYDLSYLPDSIHLVYDDSTEIRTCHNIFIDSSSGLLYACGVKNSFTDDAMKVFSLSNPEVPAHLYNYNFVDYVHDVFVRNDTAYINAGNEGLRVADFSNPTMPLALGALTLYTEQGYNHSGWLSEDGTTYVLCDETAASPFKILDVSDLTDIQVVNYTKPPTFDQTLPHNVMFKDGLAYFSYYADGLQIYDVRNPEDLKRVGYYDTYAEDDIIFKGAWGIYAYLPSGRLLISDRTSGLFLLGYDAPPNLVESTLEYGIYGNPVVGDYTYFYFKQNEETTYTIEVFDIRGRSLSTYKGNSDYLKMDLNGYADGLYTYRYSSPITNLVLTGKFLVAKGK